MKPQTKTSGIIFSILALITALGCLFLMIKVNPNAIAEPVVQAVIWVAVVIEALIYFGKGGRKEDSRFFKAFAWTFMAGFVFNMLVLIINPVELANDALQITNAAEAVIFILWTITYSCFLLLAYSQNLGVKKTGSLTYVAIINTLIIIFIQLILLGTSLAAVCDGLTRLFAIIVFNNIFKAKYEDKEARGTD